MHRAILLVPAFVLAQAGFVQWASAVERPPAAPDLTKFAAHFPTWGLLREDPIEQDVRDNLKADQLLSRTYWRLPGGTPVSLLVAWFQTQSRGDRQPHSPQVCLPGAGWTPILSDQIQIEAGGTTIPANRYVAVNNGQRAVILYWYQTSNRAVASEWASKFWTVWDAFGSRRTDIALVRLVMWPNGEDYGKSTADGVEFAKEMYPVLLGALPAQ